MNSSLFKKVLPHLIAIAVFAIVAIVFCKPALDGKVLSQSDVTQQTGMAKQSEVFYAKYGHYPLWTESAFSGMPAYTIANPSSATILNKLVWFLYSYNPIILFFFACVCFYFLTQVLKLNVWLGVLSSIGFAYASFTSILLAVGHNTEMLAMAFMPAVVAGFLLLTQKKYIQGLAALGILVGLQSSVTQHVQIVYYTGIILGFIAIAFLIKSWKEKQIKNAFLALSLAVVAGIIGFCTNAVAYLPVQEYAKETMRGGKSELTPADTRNKTKGGLDKDYAFNWSYGIKETGTLFVPGMYGGGTIGREYSESKFADKLQEVGYPEGTALQAANGSSYWGEQPTTAGPVYLGAVICFLFILGLVYVKSWHKWWIVSVSLFAIVLAWGKNFSAFNYFIFDHMPFYNKFRSPTMALVIPQLAFPLLAALGLDQLISENGQKELVWKKFKTTVFITAGLIVLMGLFYMMSDFKGGKDAQLKQNFSMGMLQQLSHGKEPSPELQQRVSEQVNAIFSGLQEDRQSLYGWDLFRTLLFVTAAVVLAGLYIKDRIKPVILLAGLTILSSYDLLAEGRKYLNDDSFVEPVDNESQFQPSTADEKINADPEKNFRVFDQSNDAFQDSHASYFHNSLGGYSPAKLGLYQDIIENQLTKNNLSVFNMLNTKYFIRKNAGGTDDDALVNPNAFGSCWLVKSIHYVNSADEEMKALDSINLRDTAIVRKNFQDNIKFPPVPDSTASIQLIENLNDKISYKFSSKTNQFAVFSEVYYDKGWDAYIDGNKTAYCKVDYVLRGMAIPAGDHIIEFRFEPRSVIIGSRISLISSLIGYGLLFAAIYVIWKNRNIQS